MSTRSLGLLKLSHADAPAYQRALSNYGFASSASFLRAAALALIRHDKAKEELVTPIRFHATKPK
jgi:hypothetical protein